MKDQLMLRKNGRLCIERQPPGVEKK
jgi:hypothetical protein